jgi:hypothetical protein
MGKYYNNVGQNGKGGYQKNYAGKNAVIENKFLHITR